jgi:hypothetical protein
MSATHGNRTLQVGSASSTHIHHKGDEHMKQVSIAAIALALTIGTANSEDAVNITSLQDTLTAEAQEPTHPKPLSRCEDSMILDGVFGRGSLECNSDWLDRNASYIILKRVRSCLPPAKKLKEFVNRGIHDFDRTLAELGKTKACAKLDDSMSTVERDYH